MKFGRMTAPLLAAALMIPAAARAQEADDCRRTGMIGIVFAEADGAVRITGVRRGSPADRAGVREGDAVARVNGQPVTAEAFQASARCLQAGDTVRFALRGPDGEREVEMVAVRRSPAAFRVETVRGRPGEDPVIIVGGDSMPIPLRALTFRLDSLHERLRELDGEEIRIRVDSMVRIFSDSMPVFLERMPAVEIPAEVFAWPDDAEGVRRPFFLELGRRAAAGAELAEMNEGLGRYFPNARRGALVIEVSDDSPAARAGLQAGDVIVRAGGDEVASPEDVRRALMRSDDGRVAVEVVRQGRRRTLTLEWSRPEVHLRRAPRPDRR